MPAPPNGTCGTATVVGAVPYSITVDTTGASSDPSVSPSCTFGTADKAVWWSYTNPSSNYRLLTVDTGGTSYFNAISIWSGACGALTQKICTASTYDAFQSVYMSWAVAPGETLHVLITDVDFGLGGSLVLAINAVELPTGSLVAGTNKNTSLKKEQRDAFSGVDGSVLSRDASTPSASGLLGAGIYRAPDDKLITFNGQFYEFSRSMGVLAVSAPITPPADWATQIGIYKDQVGHLYIAWGSALLDGQHALTRLDQTTYAVLDNWVNFLSPFDFVPLTVAPAGDVFYFSKNKNEIFSLDLTSVVTTLFATYSTWNPGTQTGYRFTSITGQTIPADGRLIVFPEHFTGSGVSDGIRVLVYSSAGALLQDWPVTSAYAGSTIVGSALPDNDLSVWVIDNTVYLDEYRLADGARLSHFDVTSTGSYQGLIYIPTPSGGSACMIVGLSGDCASSQFTVSGSGFQGGATIELRGPTGDAVPFTVVSFSATQIVLQVSVILSGRYCVTVTNP